MKRIGILLLVAVACLSLFVACQPTECEHTYGDWQQATAPTCTQTGSEQRTCTKCGNVDTRDVDALGHDLVHHEATAATCTTAGNEEYDTCTRCDYTTYKEIAKLAHSLVDHPAVAATCTTAGNNAYQTCENCDYTTYEEIPALGHDPIQHEAVAATCTQAGHNAYETCSRCDYTTYKEIPALQHDIKTHERVEPTYTKPGYEAYDYCTRGDYEATKTEIPAKGFTYRDVTVELYALARYAADGATLKLRLVYADDPDQIVSLANVEFERFAANIPDGATKVQLLRYAGDGTTLWEQTDEYDMDDTITAFMVKSNGEICREVAAKFVYINYNVTDVYTGGERFGVYFYNDTASEWQQSVLNTDKIARHVLPDGMTKFKILRTSIKNEPISWDSDFWGATDEVVLGDNNYFVFTDFNGGNMLGQLTIWGATADIDITLSDEEHCVVSADKQLTDIPTGSTIKLTFTATDGYYVKEVTVDGNNVTLADDGSYTMYVFTDVAVVVTVEAGSSTDKRIVVDLTPVVEGNEIFGVYLYNTAEGNNDNEWVKATLNGKTITVTVTEKYNAFKILRTDPSTRELSWDGAVCAWWGQSSDIVLQDDCTRYVITAKNDGNWSGEWIVPLPTSVTFDFSATPNFVSGGEQFVIVFVNEEEMTTRKVIGTVNGTSVTADAVLGETKVYLYRVALDADTSADNHGYAGWGQTYELTLVGGKGTFSVTSVEGDKFVGNWN